RGEREYEKNDGERWKMMLVSKQYKFLWKSFLVLAFVPIIEIIWFIGYILFDGNITGLICNVTIISLLILGNSFQILGFFYPVPRSEKILMEPDEPTDT
nr:hypothetical protein [Candidatus Sigynarchaeota archaeon]